jgi:hypothetical protein
MTRTDDAFLRRPRACAPAPLVTDLERFWPSRRGHAFDEFCR